MHNILVLNTKGGSGKSTIATNLASYYVLHGREVLLMDHDPQGSATAWLDQRSPSRALIRGAASWRGGVRVSKNNEIVIIDAPAGLRGRELSNLLRRVETVLVPVLPSPLDMLAAENFIQQLKNNARVSSGQAKIALIANRVREHTNIYAELGEFLRDFRIPMLGHLRDSMNYLRAAEQGLGIFDMAPYATQIDREQWRPIIRWLNSKRSRKITN